MKRKRQIGITPTRKRGPVPPPGGRVRIMVNIPRSLLPFVQSLPGRSASAKIVGCLDVMASAKPTPISKGL